MVRKYSLEIVVFISGAVVMVLEIVGSRVLAPYVGTSIIAWTSIIGVILASLSLGYWWGGSLADSQPTYRRFSYVLLLSGLFIVFLAWTKDVILETLMSIPDLRARSVLSAALLFGPASTVLGMISPFAVRLRMHEVATSGRTVGRLYAISTIGSIVGTFATGFFLLALFGSTNILFLLAAVQLLSSLCIFPKLNVQTLLGITFLAASYMSPHTFFPYRASAFRDFDTQYHRVWVYDVPEGPRTIRYLDTEYLAHQSGMDIANPDFPLFDYVKMYRLADHFNPAIKRALLIGGGGYSYAKDFLNQYPRAHLDVAEIDPGLTEIAKKYFNLPESSRISIHHGDGRLYVQESTEKYDVIIGDAFRSSFSVPYQLTTTEAAEEYKRLLGTDGVMLLNVISSLEGPKSEFLKAEYATFKKVFPQVHVFPVLPHETDEIQNVLLIAFASPKTPSFTSANPEYALYLARRWTRPVEGGVLLTDEFAPVEQLLMKAL